MPLPPEPGPLRSRRSQGAARKRDGMQLLLIGSQVGKLWFLLAFPLSLSFFNFLFLAFFPPPPPFSFSSSTLRPFFAAPQISSAALLGKLPPRK